MKRWARRIGLFAHLGRRVLTNYYTYSGSGIYQGRWGASKNVERG
jgi:hypothetical protein